ncbi:TRAP transporter large permease [Halococcus salifodinae]|uniref:Putative TRAP dicarboxylate transporter n=1 Tax=Halococcus salifodinae DSM 8989 TaxID=1227456 RepID=M0NB18_9EURY|nr:TRAP transporter large permease [Halococcus salifodinae]EMA54768.1 putative TRAP dicarboxylate transporter [Halococcus salifodinae DSM 8989]
MSGEILLALAFLVVLLSLYLLGVHVAFAIGISSVVIMLLPFGPGFNVQIVAQRFYTGLNSFILIAVPFFLLAGRIMNEVGMTEDIFDFAEELVGPVPGGLGHVNVVVSMIFSGMSGSAVADAAGLGVIEYRSMVDRGYDENFAAGITGASSTIGPIIPPSIPIIVYGVLANVSIGALFIAGVVPGLLMGLSLMGMVLILSFRGEDIGTVQSYDLGRLGRTFLRSIPALITPVIIVGGILTGMFTPTEAAIVATIYALAVGFFYYRSLSFSSLYKTTQKTFLDTAVLLFIIGIANLYGYLLVLSGVPDLIAGLLLTVSSDPTVVILILAVILLLLGTFMETLAIITVMVPILIPIFPDIGINPLSFGIIMMVVLMIGIITPPFGIALFSLERVTDRKLEQIVRGVAPFYIPLILIALALILVPDIVLALPRSFGLT